MVNPKTGMRELAYVVKVDCINPLPGYDRVEQAVVGGWCLVVKKDQFKPGDLGIYFEIDSKVPAVEPFLFLESKHYKIKTQRMCKSISQGLLMHPSDFGWTLNEDGTINADGDTLALGDFLTARLNVTYASEEDNARKGINPTSSKYQSMAARNKERFKKAPYRWLMRYELGRKFLFLIFGKKRDTIPTHFPTKFNGVSKTDSERVENMPWVLKDKSPLIVTSKVDGTSSTFILEKKPFGKYEYYVCSRNVRQLVPDQKNFHAEDENVYWEVSDKFHIKEFLKDYIEKNNFAWAAIQGETAGISLKGVKIQGNPHGLGELSFFAFDLINSKEGKVNPVEGEYLVRPYGINWVPIISTNFVLPDTMEEFKKQADGPCDIKHSTGLREGFVYRRADNPNFNFKNVSNQYLLKKKE